MTKKVLLLLLVLFVGFWMFTDPSNLAVNTRDAAGGVWGMLVSIFGAIIRFLGVLF